MSKTIHEVDVDGMIGSSKRLVENYSKFVRHTPAMLRNSLMMAYQTAVDDMLKAMDHNRINGAVKQDITPPVVLLDQNGNAS